MVSSGYVCTFWSECSSMISGHDGLSHLSQFIGNDGGLLVFDCSRPAIVGVVQVSFRANYVEKQTGLVFELMAVQFALLLLLLLLLMMLLLLCKRRRGGIVLLAFVAAAAASDP